MNRFATGEAGLASGLTLLLGCFFAVALWELFRPRRALQNPVAPRWLGNLAVYFINGALFAWLFPAPMEMTTRLEARLGIELLHWPQLNYTESLVVGVLLLDFLRYWMHRAFHVTPWLWRLHSLHHADSDLDVSTSFRHHPIEFTVGTGFFWILFVVMRFPPEVVAAYLLCTSILSCLQHGNISVPPAWETALQKVIVTPEMHRIHHSTASDEANSNFGFLFSFWDRLFATHRQIVPKAHARIQFGLTEFRNPSIWLMLLLPLLVRPAPPPLNDNPGHPDPTA